ncbi:hypothetical protein C0992_010546 [Termitomyces sp. T32_za158]|nr:hypothetical protein C0992_010546 [Termitomyces sp. T32_za158]
MNGVLPKHASPVEEKIHRSAWTRPVTLPIPGVAARRLRILVPNVRPFQPRRSPRRPLLVAAACLAVLLTFFLLPRTRDSRQWADNWPASPPSEQSTLVFRRADLQRIWLWEIASGHYPSAQPVPSQIALTSPPHNPARRHRRTYLDIQSVFPNVAYPPRPVPGSVADMDSIMKYCNFSANKYVRDCLEVLRIGGGLDNGRRTRRGNTDDWKYIYTEHNATALSHDPPRPLAVPTSDPDALVKKRNAELEPPLVLPAPPPYRPSSSLDTPCDPENPKLFHMFWTGPFTDKPYLALLSFLYTQNTGMHLPQWPPGARVCRPQFWLWINPGPAASVPNPSAHQDMLAQLRSSPWASPFLDPRFKDVIKFKLWNTTEQLDGVPEIKDEWRTFKTLFNSGGHVISVPKDKDAGATDTSSSSATTTKKDEDDMLNRTGSKSSASYDRLSVILSDMARFILCHRFGGIYLDADTILLRDWEELWGWKGAFAYRWSRLEKYNTAVLKMHRASALGAFLFRTALRNGLDFHPMSVSTYMADAGMEPLLLRLPDALFDSAWLNTESYQRDRPPQPFFTEFADFFDTPAQDSAAPQALGFDGFFKGAYSYHFHNFWCVRPSSIPLSLYPSPSLPPSPSTDSDSDTDTRGRWKPFDPSRNWPDLGPRFEAGETAARAALRAERERERGRRPQAPAPAQAKAHAHAEAQEGTQDGERGEGQGREREGADKRDLDWSTVLKRTFEAYVRGEQPNMYGEWLVW